MNSNSIFTFGKGFSANEVQTRENKDAVQNENKDIDKNGKPHENETPYALKFEPLFNNILIRRVEDIMLFGKSFQKNAVDGMVVAIGPDVKVLKVGDTVVILKEHGIELDEKYYLCPEVEVKAKLIKK